MNTGSSVGASQLASVDRNIFKIRDLVYQEAGIFHSDNKLYLLQERCTKRLRELKVKTLAEYLQVLGQPGTGRQELVKLLNEITVGETCFFRSRPQLDALSTVVLPGLMAARVNSPLRKLRFWSAGCSTGEEPYSLAMFLLEECAALVKGWTIEIRATDLNERSLAAAEQALYDEHTLRNVNTAYRMKYFVADGDRLQVTPETRQCVTFARLNLLDEGRMALMRDVDVIFCANVLIYFDIAAKRKVVEQFHNSLQSNGYLFLSNSETLYGVTERFELVHFPSATGYVKGHEAEK